MAEALQLSHVAEEVLEDVPYGKRNLPDFQQVLQSHLNACPKDSDFRVEKNSIYCRDCVQRVACSRWEALHDLSKYSQHCQTAGHIDYRESSRGNLISPVAALSPSLPTKRASTSNSTSFSHLPRASLSSSQTKPEPLSDDDVVITSVTTRPAASQRKRRSPQMTSENNDDDDVSFVSYKKPRTSTSSSATSRRTTPAVKKGKPLSVLEWLKPKTEDNPGATQPSGFHSSPDNGPLIQTKQEEYKPQLPTYPNDRPSLEPRHSLGQLDHNQERKPSLSNKPEPEDPFNVGSTDRKRNLIMQRAQALLANFVPSFTVPTASSSAPDPMAGPVAGPSSAPMLSRSSTALAPPPAPTAVASPMTSDGRFNWATQAIFPPYGATATTAGMMGYNPMSLAPDSALGLHALPGLSWPYHAALNEDDEFNDELNLNQSFNGVMENLRGTVPTSQDRAEFTAAAAKAIEFQGSLGLAEACKTLGITNIKKLFLPGLAEDFMLMPHQVLGIAFMVRQEGLKKIHGGILADEMGLGKTVQAIGLMCFNKPTADDKAEKRKTTLLLAPLALLEQWKEEIETKTEKGRFRCLIYHGDKKHKSLRELQSYDVIITTFNSLAMEWQPDDLTARRAAKAKAKKAGHEWTETEEENWEPAKDHGPLFEMKFHRVIIDEAHNIRNRATRLSRAVCRLSAKYRWCLTGTPILNNLADAFSLVRFLRIRPYYDWTEFRDRVVKHERNRPDFAAKRCLAILQPIMMRRKKDSKLDGKPLLQLPEKHVHEEWLDFDPEEREIYEAVQTKMQIKFKKFLREGTVLRNYSQVLVLLLRLRQICSHPALLAEDVENAAIQESQEKRTRRERNRAILELGKDKVEQIKKRLREELVESIEFEKKGEETHPPECICCYEALVNDDSDLVTACGHVFCESCIDRQFDINTEVLGAAAGDGANEGTEHLSRPCYTCRQPFTRKRTYLLSALRPTQEELDDALGIERDDEKADDSDELPITARKQKRAPRKGIQDDSDDDELPDISVSSSKGKGKQRAIELSDLENAPPTRVTRSKSKPSCEKTSGKKSRKREDDSADENGDLRGFIVGDDTDESGHEDVGNATLHSDSDGESEEEIIHFKGKKPKKMSFEDDVAQMSDNESELDVFATSIKPPKRDLGELTKHFKDSNDDDKVIPSTKMKAMLEHLLAIKEKGESSLVFSQFTTALDIVARYLREHNIKFVRYQGSMTRLERDAAVRAFQKSKRVDVMIMSLKCGGVGLNLCRANHVINTDLAFAPAVELQAWDRVHRLGQHKECHIRRLLIRNSVEDRLLAIQARKSHLSNGALGEGTNSEGRQNRKLTVSDLAMLFGLGDQDV